MRLFLAILIITAFSLLPPVWADLQTTLDDLRFHHNQYLLAADEFSQAKAKYQKFKTLPVETEAFGATKKVLIARNGVLVAHFLLLRERAEQTAAINPTDWDSLNARIGTTLDFLTNHNKRIEASTTIAQLDQLSEELESQRGEFETLSTQVTETTIVGKLNDFAATGQNFLDKIEQKIEAEKDNLPDYGLRKTRINQAGQNLAVASEQIAAALDNWRSLHQVSKFQQLQQATTARSATATAKSNLEDAVFALTQAMKGLQ